MNFRESTAVTPAVVSSLAQPSAGQLINQCDEKRVQSDPNEFNDIPDE